MQSDPQPYQLAIVPRSASITLGIIGIIGSSWPNNSGLLSLKINRLANFMLFRKMRGTAFVKRSIRFFCIGPKPSRLDQFVFLKKKCHLTYLRRRECEYVWLGAPSFFILRLNPNCILCLLLESFDVVREGAAAAAAVTVALLLLLLGVVIQFAELQESLSAVDWTPSPGGRRRRHLERRKNMMKIEDWCWEHRSKSADKDILNLNADILLISDLFLRSLWHGAVILLPEVPFFHVYKA